jgi:hypothetical protein
MTGDSEVSVADSILALSSAAESPMTFVVATPLLSVAWAQTNSVP